MKILVANRHLEGLGGSETFTYTLAAQLQAAGHDVEYFTLFKGITSEKIEELGISFSKGINYDLIIAGQIRTVEELRVKRYTGPLVQICHGAITKGEQPHPKADAYIAISEEVQQHLKSKGINAPVILNGINCQRFKPRRKLRKKLKVIASLVQTDEAHEIVELAAKIIGVEVIRLNKYEDKVWEVEKAIDKADLVVSLGRGCYEAMACGRPVVIFDKRRYQEQFGDGYLFPFAFEHYVQKNCSGRFLSKSMNVGDLVDEFKKYDSEHGKELRDIAVEQLNISVQANKILEYCRPLIDGYNYPGTVDVVYILGKGSKWGDNEIRYSIRSFRQYYKDLRNVVIVGELPSFLQGVVHIPYPDKQELNKDAKMMLKIMAACCDERVSENFILCTDDTALLQPLSFTNFKGWHEGPIMYDANADYLDHMSEVFNPKMKGAGTWFDFVYATGRELQRRGLPDNNYDRAHSPQPVNKREFIEVMKQWDMINNKYTISNIYNNSSTIFTGENIKGRNLKVYGPATADQLDELTTGRLCINYSDPSLDDNMKEWLSRRFPEPAEYEVFITTLDRRTAVQEWFKNGCDYDEGVGIFQQFAPKNRPLLHFFHVKKDHPLGMIKLKSTLRLWMR